MAEGPTLRPWLTIRAQSGRRLTDLSQRQIQHLCWLSAANSNRTAALRTGPGKRLLIPAVSHLPKPPLAVSGGGKHPSVQRCNVEESHKASISTTSDS